MYNSGLGYIGDETFDPGSGTVPVPPMTWVPPPSPIDSNPWIYDTSGGGFDTGGFITSVMKLLPNVVSSFKGNPYGQAPGYGGQQGQQGGGQGGLNLTGSSILGGGSLGISSTTLLLLGAVALIFFMKK